MKIYSRLGVAFIFCLVVLAGGWPVTQAVADTKTSTYYTYIPFYTSVSLTIEGLGPDGGGVTSMLLDPKNPQVAYTGTWGGGVFKSLDSGKTWKSASSGLGNFYIQSMAIDPVHPATIYSGTYRSGVYKTTDGGASWTFAGKGLNTSAIVYALAIDPSNTNTLYAGTRSPGSNPPWGGGVFKSTDGGKTWSNDTHNLGEDWVYGLAVDSKNTQIIYAATHSKGVFKSTNGGGAWTAVNNGISDQSMRTVAIDPTNSQVVYAGCWHTTGVFKTTNGGQSWTTVSNGLNGAKIISITIDPLHPQTLYALSYLQGVYKSTNGASSWSQEGLSPYYVFNLTVNPTNDQALLASAVNVALYSSSNGGGSWAKASSGLHATTVTAVAADPSSPGVVYAGLTNLGLYRSQDYGQTWTSENAGLGDLNVRSLAVVSGSLYVGTDGGGIYKTATPNVGWQALKISLPQASGKTPAQNPALSRFDHPGPDADLLLGETDHTIQPKSVTISTPILALAPAPSSPATLYAATGGSGVYHSTNAGASWQADGLSGKTVYSLVVDRSNPAIVYAGTNSAGGSLWKTLDGGAHWGQIITGLNGLDVLSLNQNPDQINTIYAGTSKGVFRSIDAGANWTPLGLTGQAVNALVANPYSANTLAAGTVTNGLFISFDGGATWSNLAGLINPEVLSLAFGDPYSRPLYIGTLASGAFRLYTPSPSLY